MKYRKGTMLNLLKEKVNEVKLDKITRSRIGIALLVLENESKKSIETVYGYDLEKELK